MSEEPGAIPAVLKEPEFCQLLSWEVQRAHRYQDFLSLCLVQLDQRPAPIGVTREAVAQRLVELLRASDIVGMVGDDIAVLLVHTPETDAAVIMERLRQQMQKAAHIGPDGVSSAGLSLRLALASFPTDATIDVELVARARGRLDRMS